MFLSTLLSALAAVPRLADAIERAASALEYIGEEVRAAKARARKERKDDESDNAVDDVLARHGLFDDDAGEDGERAATDDAP